MDTNALSERLKKKPDPKVKAWLEALPLSEAFISARPIGEIAQGVAHAPGPQRPRLQAWLEEIKRGFRGRILPLDEEVMETWGLLTGEALKVGRPVSPLDAMLAATALFYGLTLVTRNTRHFEGWPPRVLNPWTG